MFFVISAVVFFMALLLDLGCKTIITVKKNIFLLEIVFFTGF